MTLDQIYAKLQSIYRRLSFLQGEINSISESSGGGGGTSTTNASQLTSGILPVARLGDQSITEAKLATAVVTKLNAVGSGGNGTSLGYFVVVADTTGVTDATSAINAAIQAAIPTKGTVYIPSGTYKIAGTINWDYRVNLTGDGWQNTILKSSTASVILNNSSNKSVIPAVNVYEVRASISNLQFDGNSIGVTALDLQFYWMFKCEKLFIHDFTGISTKLNGVLVGEFNTCVWNNNPNGSVKAITSNADSIYGTMQSNLVEFTNCNFYRTTTTFAVDWSGSASVQFRYCDFELCGSDNNENTGVINFNQAAIYNEGVALLLDGCWVERTAGNIIVINQTSGNTRSIIQNTIISPSGGLVNAVKVLGTGTNANKVFITGSTLSGGIVATGEMAMVSAIESTITQPTLSFSAVYRNYDNLFSNIADVTPPVVSSASVANSTPTQIILTYNEALLTTSTPATTDFTLSGGKTASAVSVSGNSVIVTANSAYANGDVITISYTGGTNKIKDLAGNIAANLTNQSVTNNIAALGGSSSITTGPLTGLAAGWNFEETSGALLDGSGNSKDLNVTGTVTRGTGKVGNAVTFDGTSGYLSTSTGTSLSAGSGFSIAFWFKTSSSSTQVLFQKGVTGNSSFEYDLYYSAGSMGFEASSNGVGAVEVSRSFAADDTWRFVSIVWDGTSMIMKINNGSGSSSSLGSFFSGTANLFVGASPSGSNKTNGSIDQMRIYNRALTDSEVTTLYNAGTGL